MVQATRMQYGFDNGSKTLERRRACGIGAAKASSRSCWDIPVKSQRDMMIVEKLYKSQKYPYHMVLEKEKGKFFKFSAAPFRKITEQDLSPLPYFRPVGRDGEEAPGYMYRAYGLEKGEMFK